MVGHPLKEYRKREKLSQGELASQFGVVRETVARWETGVRKIDLDKLSEVSRVTGIAAEKLRPDLAPFVNAEAAQ